VFGFVGSEFAEECGDFAVGESKAHFGIELEGILFALHGLDEDVLIAEIEVFDVGAEIFGDPEVLHPGDLVG
jgi:hypothetical protein